MVRFMLVTFAFLAWAFYVMSGGSDFDPDRARLDRQDPLDVAQSPEPTAEEPPAESIEVTRVTLDLTSVQDVLRGNGDTRTGSSLPQQPLSAVAAEPQDETTAIFPSLVENATPESQVFDPDGGETFTAERASLDTSDDVRVVSGSRVNVRGGPGTGHGVVDTLVQGDEVEVLDDSGTGWVRIRATGAGTVGWMAASLLTRG